MSNSTSYVLGPKQNLATTPGGTAQVVFNWNTTKVGLGWYNANVTVNSVPGETVQNQADNNLAVKHIVRILPMSDVDQDGRVALIDAGIFYYDFNSVPGSPRWNPLCDISNNGVIDIVDAGIVTAQYRINA